MGLFGTLAASFFNNEMAGLREGKAREENYMYGEMSAANADQRTRALYRDLYSPAAQIRQLKEAGLSPSIYASGGLAGKSGTSGAQGTGANGISPNVFGVSALETAQIQNIKANTNKTNAETSNIESQTEYTKLLTDNQKIENYIKDSTKDFSIQQVVHQTELYKEQVKLTIEQAKGQKLQNTFDASTMQERINQMEATTQNIIADTGLKILEQQLTQSNIELNEKQKELIGQQIKESVARIQQKWEELKIARLSAEAQKQWFEDQAKNLTNTYNLAVSRLEFDKERLDFDKIKLSFEDRRAVESMIVNLITADKESETFFQYSTSGLSNDAKDKSKGMYFRPAYIPPKK